MRFHPKGLLILAGFAALVLLGVNWRWTIAGIIAIAVVDALSLLLPFTRSSRTTDRSQVR